MIARASTAIDDAQSQLKAANSEAEFYKHKKGLPLNLRNKIEDANRDIAYNQKNMTDHEAELGRINGKFDDTLRRYRELASTAAEAQAVR